MCECLYELIHNDQKLEIAPRVHHQEKSEPGFPIAIQRVTAQKYNRSRVRAHEATWVNLNRK